MDDDPSVLAHVVAVLLDLSHRAALLRLRLGIPPARSGFPRRIPRLPRGRTPTADDPFSALLRRPHRVRGGHDQDARGQLLAGSVRHGLSPSDPAHAQSVQPPCAPDARLVAPRGDSGQPYRPAQRTVAALPAPTHRVVRRAVIIITQLALVITGNYAWLNWATILLAFAGISDSFLGWVRRRPVARVGAVRIGPGAEVVGSSVSNAAFRSSYGSPPVVGRSSSPPSSCGSAYSMSLPCAICSRLTS